MQVISFMWCRRLLRKLTSYVRSRHLFGECTTTLSCTSRWLSVGSLSLHRVLCSTTGLTSCLHGGISLSGCIVVLFVCIITSRYIQHEYYDRTCNNCSLLNVMSASRLLYNNVANIVCRKFHKNHKDETIQDLHRQKLDVVVTTYETCRDHICTLNVHVMQSANVEKLQTIFFHIMYMHKICFDERVVKGVMYTYMWLFLYSCKTCACC